MSKLEILHSGAPTPVDTGTCIKTKFGWRPLTPTVCKYRYEETAMKPWDVSYDRDKDPKYNPQLRTNKIVSFEDDDGRYRDGFVVKDGVEWTHKAWTNSLALKEEHRQETAARLHRRGVDEDFEKIPTEFMSGRVDKWGVRVMS